MRRRCTTSETYDFYALSRDEDVCAASKDWATFSSARGTDLSTLSAELADPIEALLMMDPPKHDRLRALVSRVFTLGAVTALEPMVAEVIDGKQLDTLDGRTTFDAAGRFHRAVPGGDHLAHARRCPSGDGVQPDPRSRVAAFDVASTESPASRCTPGERRRPPGGP